MSEAREGYPTQSQLDYTFPIARGGEQQFACVVRQRSGMDAGMIDSGTRCIRHLRDSEQQDAVDAAYAIYERWIGQTGKRAHRDQEPDPSTPFTFTGDPLTESQINDLISAYLGSPKIEDDPREFSEGFLADILWKSNGISRDQVRAMWFDRVERGYRIAEAYASWRNTQEVNLKEQQPS